MPDRGDYDNAKKILQALRVPATRGTWNVFQVGSTSTPLNFASQQMRAFKLTWALDKVGLIRSRQIAVVGGGLAGVTAGIVCLLRGAKQVSLYDRAHEIMALQHGALHRYVHPFIFMWPGDGAEKERTEFPILNWRAGTADEIRALVFAQAHLLLRRCYRKRGVDTHERDFQHRVGCEVRHLFPMDRKIQLLAEGPDSRYVAHRDQFLPVGTLRNYQEIYDVVIATVGFGLESEFPGVPFRSYWHLDTLSQPTIRGVWPRRWLVSGTGDGGLIDAIRLRLFDADQRKLTEVLTGTRSKLRNPTAPENWKTLIDELRAKLLQIETSYSSGQVEPAGSSVPKKKSQLSRSMHLAFSALHGQHKDDEPFESLKRFLMSRERTDTVVYLNGRQEMPYEPGAAMFQRFLIYLLRRYCGLRYRWGTPHLLEVRGSGGPYRFRFERGDTGGLKTPIEELEVDEVVIRHGAESALGALFGPDAVKSSRENSDLAEFERTLWTENLEPSWARQLATPILPVDPLETSPQ
jgi:hypothetical protein